MKILLIALMLFTSQVFAYDDKHFNPDLWPYVQERLFGLRTAVELPNNDELTVSGPLRAASGAQVPVTITVNTDRFVKIYLIIDANPIQHAATFKLTDRSQNTEISTRIRMETDSYVRVVGETANGELFTHKTGIRASGGCSGYMDVHDPALTKDLGKILFKDKKGYKTTRIKHPMFSGLQKDLESGGYIPKWIIKTITWVDEEEYIIMQADTKISISQDPYIKFKYDGKVNVIAEDTKGNIFKK